MTQPEYGPLARLAKRRGVRQFVKFSIVGLSGLIVNLIIFTLIQQLTPVELRAQRYSVTFAIAFLSGGVSNYALNRAWTFRSSGHPLRESLQFLTVSVIALFVGIGAKVLLHPYLGTGHRMWLVSTLAGVLVNFFINKYWTFRTS